MKPFNRMEKEILTALQQAEKQGQPIAALFEAVAECTVYIKKHQYTPR